MADHLSCTYIADKVYTPCVKTCGPVRNDSRTGTSPWPAD